jgi:hypothetical protein
MSNNDSRFYPRYLPLKQRESLIPNDRKKKPLTRGARYGNTL